MNNLHSANQDLNSRLNQRRQAGNYRTLKPEQNGLCDFSSNDYLGFARSTALNQMISKEMDYYHAHLNGSTGSRLLTGNTDYACVLEQYIASYHQHEAGLLFNSGYDANIGLFSSIPQRGDTVITDELIHASIIDGIRLSNANRYTFKHNNLESLEQKLQNAKGRIYVAIESVYSMDGDLAPLKEIILLIKQYEANLIIDEAHAIGIFGKGLVDELDVKQNIFATVITFGKALGTHGAIVLGSDLLKNYLINFARSFIYSTAASFHQLVSIKMAYQLLAQSLNNRLRLWDNINLLKQLSLNTQFEIAGLSAINCVMAGSNEKALTLSTGLKNAGLDVRPVLSPTVAPETERLRICMHSYNTESEIRQLVHTLKEQLHG